MDPVTAAKSYVEDKLKVEFVPDKCQLLNKIVRAFLGKVPYQNISTSILPPEERLPTEREVVENGTSLKGGLSVHNNWFFKMLLEALGYKVEFLAASVESPPSSTPREFGSHFAILVKDLKQPGDFHLVDVGFGFPFFKAIPLDNLPHIATEVGITYRFVEEDGLWHVDHKDSEEFWTRVISYKKESTGGNPGELFRGPLLDLLREDWLIGGITATNFPEPRSSVIPDAPDFNKDLDYLIRFNHDLLIISNGLEHTTEERIPQDKTLQTFQDFFPTIPKNEVEKKIKIAYEDPCHLRY